MKLSAVIEQMLVTNRYNLYNEFMCLVLCDEGFGKYIEHVEAMVHAIYPEANYGYPLYSALYEKGVLDLENKTFEEGFKVTKELYVWWVFDLKRKGL
jgi:hypothetical protein